MWAWIENLKQHKYATYRNTVNTDQWYVFELWRLRSLYKLINNGSWTEWSAIWSEIIRVISKLNERAARVRFEFTSMILDQIARHSVPEVQLPLY